MDLKKLLIKQAVGKLLPMDEPKPTPGKTRLVAVLSFIGAVIAAAVSYLQT